MKSEKTLFERLGGEATIEKLVTRFYARVLADPQLSPFFKDVSVDKLIRMQREFFGTALDGPQSYSGLSLGFAHSGRGINGDHFNRFAQHLLKTLKAIDIPDDDIREVVHRISVHKNDITGESY